MNVRLGVDTLTYHCRLAAGEISLPEVFEEVAGLGGEFVQVNVADLEGHSTSAVGQVRKVAEKLGLGLTFAGSYVGTAARGDTVEAGARRVREWLELADALGSPYARISSGFYRNELRGDVRLVRAEQQYVVDVLAHALGSHPGTMKVLLENHSDFTPDEYVEIVGESGSGRVGVFLDVINPVSLLIDPLPVVERLAPLAVAGHVKDYRLESRYIEDRLFRRGFDLRWCYPGEGVADLAALIGALAGAQASPYLLSIEGLDNRAGVADQRPRLDASLCLLRSLVEAAAPAG